MEVFNIKGLIFAKLYITYFAGLELKYSFLYLNAVLKGVLVGDNSIRGFPRIKLAAIFFSSSSSSK